MHFVSGSCNAAQENATCKVDLVIVFEKHLYTENIFGRMH